MIFKSRTLWSALLLATVAVVRGLKEENNGDGFFDTTEWTQTEKRKLMKTIVAFEKVKNNVIPEKKMGTRKATYQKKKRRNRRKLGFGHKINLALDHDVKSIIDERRPNPLSNEEIYYKDAGLSDGEVMMQLSAHDHHSYDDEDDDYDDDNMYEETKYYIHGHDHTHENYGRRSKSKSKSKSSGKGKSKGSTSTYSHYHPHIHSVSSSSEDYDDEVSDDDSPNCPDPDSENLPCPPEEIGHYCDKYSEEGSFQKCLDICEPSFCCIHDSRSREVAPSCAKKEDNCPLYSPCYIIWWKLQDTVGPAPYFYVTQTDDFYDVEFDDYIETEFSDELLNQVLGHHFDDDDINDDKFENPDSW